MAALILVAPAILAPSAVHKYVNKASTGNAQSSKENTDSSANPVTKILGAVLKFGDFIKQWIKLILEVIASALTTLYKKALSAILRSAIGVILVSAFTYLPSSVLPLDYSSLKACEFFTNISSLSYLLVHNFFTASLQMKVMVYH